MSKIIVRTEIWNTRKFGQVAKAVVRNERGTFLGATNQTKPLIPNVVLVGK